MEKKILIIDDDFSLRSVISRALSNSKTFVRSVSTISEAWFLIEKENFDLIIADVVLPDGDGLELVKKVKSKNIDQRFIIISAKNNILTAIKADQLDVFEYLPKPLDLNDLTISVNKSLSFENKKNSKIINEEKLPMIGSSQPMQNVYKIIAKTTKTDHTVLITGESGTGKELVAKAIHNFSSRSNSQFIVINMASLPPNLIESELFGYEKGAFTGAEKRTIGYFEKANSGTLFLDEIGDLPIDVQARLLRVLQFGEFSRIGSRDVINTDVRIISATNKDLFSLVKQGSFREDLYYRLNVLNVQLPPLRKRENDIILLSNHFLKKFSDGKKQIDNTAINFLKKCQWPGNIRELENLFKRISVLHSENIINEEIISELIDKGQDSDMEIDFIKQNEKDSFRKVVNLILNHFFNSIDEDDSNLNLFERITNEFEKPLIIKALDFCKGNQIKTAKLLGINRNTLRTKILKLKIPKK